MHLAAEIASQRSERKVREVNVDGTGRLLEACLALAGGEPSAGPRFVFSSTVVTGDAHGALLTEETPLPVQTPYGRSKQEGERHVLDSGLPAVVVRPSHVYGPGGWYAEELIPRLRQPGRFAVIGRGENLWDVVHVDDVAAALLLAAEQAPAGSIYHVADDEPISFYDFMALTATALGVGPPRRIPAPLARLVAGAQRGRRGRALGALLQREDQAGARLEAALPHRARGRRGRGGAAGGLSDAASPTASEPAPQELRPNARSASSATWRAIASEEVAAGEGALRTCSARSVLEKTKSSTSRPSRPSAWARTPAKEGSTSSRAAAPARSGPRRARTPSAAPRGAAR